MLVYYITILGFLLATLVPSSEATSCKSAAASCAVLPAASSTSCSSVISSSRIKQSTCTVTSTVTPAAVTKVVSSGTTLYLSTSLTQTRTIQQTLHRSSTSITVVSTGFDTTSTTTTTSVTASTETDVSTVTVTAGPVKRWIDEHLFKRALPADCSCYLTSTSTKYTTLKASTTTSIVPTTQTKSVTSVIKTTITISNVGTTQTFTSLLTLSYTSTFTETASLTETTQTVTTATVCPTPQITCAVGGSCIDTRTDDNNCGACGNVCPSDTTCLNSFCASAPPTCAGTPNCGPDVKCDGTPADVRGCSCFAPGDANKPSICANNTPGCGDARCSVSSDCVAGYVCILTCCGGGLCVPTSSPSTCQAPAPPSRLFAKRVAAAVAAEPNVPYYSKTLPPSDEKL